MKNRKRNYLKAGIFLLFVIIQLFVIGNNLVAQSQSRESIEKFYGLQEQVKMNAQKIDELEKYKTSIEAIKIEAEFAKLQVKIEGVQTFLWLIISTTTVLMLERGYNYYSGNRKSEEKNG
jgi:hypothetical protein